MTGIGIVLVLLGVTLMVTDQFKTTSENEQRIARLKWDQDYRRTFVGNGGAVVSTSSSIKLSSEPNDPGPPVEVRRRMFESLPPS